MSWREDRKIHRLNTNNLPKDKQKMLESIRAMQKKTIDDANIRKAFSVDVPRRFGRE